MELEQVDEVPDCGHDGDFLGAGGTNLGRIAISGSNSGHSELLFLICQDPGVAAFPCLDRAGNS